jgi:hypothetical protein
VTVNSLRGKIDNSEAAVEKLQSEVQTIKDRRNASQDSVRQITGEIDGRGGDVQRGMGVSLVGSRGNVACVGL